MKQFGLEANDLKQIRSVIESFPEIEEARIYGSRAIGNYKRASDIDISISGSKLTHKIQIHLHQVLEEETLLPYFFDITHYESLVNKELKKHIDQDGVVLFQKQKQRG